MIATAVQIAALRLTLLAAAASGLCPDPLRTLTTAQLLTDDLEAEINAYETWVGRQVPPGDTDVFDLAEAAGMSIPF